MKAELVSVEAVKILFTTLTGVFAGLFGALLIGLLPMGFVIYKYGRHVRIKEGVYIIQQEIYCLYLFSIHQTDKINQELLQKR